MLVITIEISKEWILTSTSTGHFLVSSKIGTQIPELDLVLLGVCGVLVLAFWYPVFETNVGNLSSSERFIKLNTTFEFLRRISQVRIHIGQRLDYKIRQHLLLQHILMAH